MKRLEDVSKIEADRMIDKWGIVYMPTVSGRVHVLEAMHSIIESLNDESYYFNKWLFIVPEAPTREDFEVIATDQDYFDTAVKTFFRICAACNEEIKNNDNK